MTVIDLQSQCQRKLTAAKSLDLTLPLCNLKLSQKSKEKFMIHLMKPSGLKGDA